MQFEGIITARKPKQRQFSLFIAAILLKTVISESTFSTLNSKKIHMFNKAFHNG
jgi:hypothetical protein